jgi:hypothetical protein
MTHVIFRGLVLRAGIVLVAGLLTWPVGVVASAASSTTFSGQATGVRATLLGTGTALADTGPLPSSGGSQEASLLSAGLPGLGGAEVLHATTIGQGDRSRSEASVANLNLTVAGNAIGATFLMSRATAVCGPGGPSASGQSEIADLVINGQPIAVSTQPNQTVNLPGGGSIVINEQTSGRAGDMTVNALHIVVPGVAEVVVASAHADITCPPPGQVTCTGADFVTGGGWIVTPSSDRGTFAVAGGVKSGAFWGHLEYMDHGTGLKAKGTGVTSYTVTGPTTRHIEGTADINGAPGTYRVDVADNGEPGRADTFSISLSTGYSAAGTLAGGNIQLHKPCQ